MNWVAWIVLLCVVLALLMLWSLSRADRARTARMRDTRHGQGSGHGQSQAHHQTNVSHGARDETRAAAYAREKAASPGASGQMAASHGHRAHASSQRWVDWLSGFSVLALIGAALFLNKCDFAKRTAQTPVSGQAIAKTSAEALPAAPAAAEAAKPEEYVQVADATIESQATDVRATDAEPAVEPEPAKTDPGVTQYYGEASPAAIMAWSAEASMNPEYANAAEAAAPAADAAPEQLVAVAEAVPGVTQYYGVAEKADADQPWSAAATPVAAEPEVPASEIVPGVTQFYGYPDENAKPPLWTEDAEINPDYAADEPAEPDTQATEEVAAAPAAEPVPGVTQYYGTSEKADADQPWAAPATVFETVAAPPAPAPEAQAVAEPVPGVTQYYGTSEKADADQPWAAPATVFETAAAPAPAPEAQAAAEPVPGVTQYYGPSSKPDAEQAWAAPATVFADEPQKQQAVEACRDALNAEVKTGKLNFYTSSWEIDSDSWPTLDRIARTAKDCSAGFVIEVAGHTDNKGKPASNKTLSELRANAVVKYLTKAGVPDSKLKAVGYGQDKPVDDNGSAEGRRKNRRIEFSVSGG